MAVAGQHALSMLDLLRADLVAFGDPGEPVRIDESQDGVTARWTQNGGTREAKFNLGDFPSFNDTSVELDGGQLSYRAFLASAAMADLHAIARNTAAVLTPSEDPFISPRGRGELEGEDSDDEADELLQQLAVPGEDRTSVVFLTADAGDGKTTLLRHATVERATAYLNGEGERIYLYVNAQGSRLARLDQALAQALDDVRAPFPYHATSALVRSGSVVLVIDGFDELIGTSGSYDEAYSSLSSFLNGLAGTGAVVAAARSAYYEQEFTLRVNRSLGFANDSWELRPLELLDWAEHEREAFTRAGRPESPETDALVAQVEQAFDERQLAPLAGKPLFVSRVVDLLADGQSFHVGDDALDRLVTAYVEREVRLKLLAPSGAVLVSAQQFRALLGELAEEMWRQEARSLSGSSVRELTGIFAELHELGEDAANVVIERLPYSAFLASAHGSGSVAFEHEVFFGYFLVRPLVEALQQNSSLPLSQALRRGRLPHEAATLAGRELHGQGSADLLRKISAATAHTESLVARENAGAVSLGLVAHGSNSEGDRIEHCDLVDLDMGGIELTNLVLHDVKFSGVDLRGSHILRSQGSEVTLRDVVVDSATVLELTGVSPSAVSALQVLGPGGGRRTQYSPEEIRGTLQRLRFPGAEVPLHLYSVSDDAFEALDELMRIYGRTNIVTEEDEHQMKRVVAHEAWPAVRDALLDAGLIVRERRQAGGNKTFLKLAAQPERVLAGQNPDADVPPQVKAFWEALKAV